MNSMTPTPGNQPEASPGRTPQPAIGSLGARRREQPQDAWEAQLDRELRNLADRPAPRTLIPRVMAALAARACLPWYRRPWWDWPSALQVLSLLCLSTLLGLATWLALHTGQLGWTGAFENELKSWLDPLSPVWSLVTTLAGAVALVIRGLNGWVLLAGGGFCVVMYLSCIGLGTACYRLAFYRRNS